MTIVSWTGLTFCMTLVSCCSPFLFAMVKQSGIARVLELLLVHPSILGADSPFSLTFWVIFLRRELPNGDSPVCSPGWADHWRHKFLHQPILQTTDAGCGGFLPMGPAPSKGHWWRGPGTHGSWPWKWPGSRTFPSIAIWSDEDEAILANIHIVLHAYGTNKLTEEINKNRVPKYSKV